MVNENKLVLWVRIFFVLIVITSIADMLADIGQGANKLHILQEALMGVFALILLMILFLSSRRQAERNHKLTAELAAATAKSAQASKQLIDARRAFGEEIAKQFSAWELTESEASVALFTLKGLSAKEIANLRNASEKTVRNQLTSIYKKSGTTGKLGFTAWFMEGLM